MSSPPDRLQLLLAQDVLTGIDFVFVAASQVTLDVYFLRAPDTIAPPLDGDLPAERISIRPVIDGVRGPPLAIAAPTWATGDNGRRVLRLQVAAPGGFATHVLRIDDPRVDPFFREVMFSFKAACPSDLDCEPVAPDCPPDEPVDAPIDYLARDFWSFRRALLDFASLRYPDWQDRLEADVGIMLVEAMSALGDELAYYQDRVAREGSLATATQRRSLRRHARLVDYDPHDGCAAMAWLDITVNPGEDGTLPTGTNAVSTAYGGTRLVYEVGRGLRDEVAGYAVDAARNSLQPYIWDVSAACLPIGSTELFVAGAHEADLPFDDLPPAGSPLPPGKWVLLRTDPADPSRPAREWMVRLIVVADQTDPLTGAAITRLAWEQAQATPFELDLTVLELRGNLVPATAGETVEPAPRFVVGADPASLGLPAGEVALLARAVERDGRDDTVAYLFSLPGAEERSVTRLGASPAQAEPEVRLFEERFAAGVWQVVQEWEWRRAFLGTASSQRSDPHFTLEDGSWRRVVGFQRPGEEIVHADYAGEAGSTLRFGDGEFGRLPPAGTVFRVRYRLGNGRATTLAADAPLQIDLPFVASAVAPLAATGGADPETAREVRTLAPEAFRYLTFRAVRPEDYAEAAERLPWVQRAGATPRWTGSWLTYFVTPDPRGAVTLADAERAELEAQLDRFRQAGRETHVAAPRYADLDLEITVCVAPTAFAGEVKARVLEALLGRGGFFAPDHFTFGTPLRRAALEAAVQAVPGVRAVEAVRLRRRGRFDWRRFAELVFAVAPDELVRVAGDPLFPERGTLRLIMDGGA